MFLKKVLVVIPAILGCLVVEARELPDFPFVYTIGSAERDVPPNLAKISFEVKDFNENPELALAAVKQQSSNIVRLLGEAGIADNDIRAYEISKNMVREREEGDNNGYQIRGYEVSRPFEVTIRDLKVYPSLLNGLVTLKNVVGINAEFEIDHRRAIEAELTVEAGADARVRAESLARAMGCELGKPFAISEWKFDEFSRVLLGLDVPNYRKSMQNGGDIFIPAVLSIKKSVYTAFELGPQVAEPNKPLNPTR